MSGTLRTVLYVSFLFQLGALHATAQRFDYHSIRRVPNRAPQDGRYEGEAHYVRQGKARVQGMRQYGAEWSQDAHLLWDGLIGDAASVQLPVRRTSRYRLVLQMTRAPDYGVFQISLDGRPLQRDVDLFATRVELAPQIELASIELKAGPHRLTFTLSGANQRAKKFRGAGYLLGLDYVQLVDLAPPPKPLPAERPPAPAGLDLTAARRLLGMYCTRCHGADEPKGGLRLDTLSSRQVLREDVERTEKVAAALAFGDMPPEDEPQPSSSERRQLARFFDRVLDERARAADHLAPTVMRRLTRYEYNNAVRDLLDLRGDVYPLPERTLRAYHDYYRPATGLLPDRIRVGNRTLGKNQVEKDLLDGVSPFAIDLQAEHGFNNRGDQLNVSPLLLETFVKLAESIVNSPQFPDYCRSYQETFVGSSPPDRARDLRRARARLETLLTRAFREPVDPPTLQRYSQFFSRQYDRHPSYTAAMKSAVSAILSSPRFLYLVESRHDSELRVAQLSDSELATRMAFFLWNTIPDPTLQRLAAGGRLNEPAVLREQVQRMLLDRRSRALSENFARQWLRLDLLTTAVPAMERFPHYYSRIGCEQWKFGLQMMVEPLLLFESVVVEDRSIMLLIDSNYSYRSDELQSWYQDVVPLSGKGNVNRFNTFRMEFVRRKLATRREGGVITTAATMTMTSSPLRTRPITRGAWVATVVFNRPPAPPPDVVPEIEADDNAIEATGITLRERLKQHQAEATCAACHAKIDPLGFALEQYDAVGRWRDTYRSGLAIDASGKLFGEAEFEDIESFKDRLLERPRIFMRAFTEHLLSYALGRPLQSSDRATVDGMVRRVAADHGRFSTVVQEVVKSRPFRHKMAQAARSKP